jgi:hypothetical protein
MQSPTITTNDYTFATSEADDHWAVRLTGDHFPGVTYMYGEIKVREVGEEEAYVDFKYSLIDSGQFEEEELNDSEDFKNYIGAVLTNIIEEAFENGKYKLNERSKHSTDDTPESPFQ